jgi:ribosome modulation factor
VFADWLRERLHDMLGQRFRFADRSAPDVTLVAVDPQQKTCRLHAIGGSRDTVPLDDFCRAIEHGVLIESNLPGFVLDRETKFDRERARRLERAAMRRAGWKHWDAAGVAGRNKRIIPFDELLRRKR